MSAPAPPDLSWQHRPTRELLRLAWPITISMLSFSAMSLVDALIVGHLGAAALAGVGLGSVVTFVLICFPFGLLRASKTLASQALGAERGDALPHHRGAALIVALAAGLLAVVVGLMLAPLVGSISEDAASGEAARSYLAIRVLGVPFVLVYRALRELLYAEGDTRTPMVATLAANALNAGLAAFVVYRLGWGVEGAAAATVVAHALEAGVLVLVLVRRRMTLALPRRIHIDELFRLGVPHGLQYVLEVGSFTILTLVLQRASYVEGAAHQIALQISHVAILPAYSIAEAASVLTGHAVGAGRDDLVRRVSRRAMLVAAIYTGLSALVSVTFAREIVSLFASSSDASASALVASATPLLWILAAFLVFDGINMVSRSVLGGAGDVRFPAVVGIASAWLMTPPLAWFLGLHLGWGAKGGWLGLCGEILVGSLILLVRVERGGWKPAAMLSRERMLATGRSANDDRDAPETAEAG